MRSRNSLAKIPMTFCDANILQIKAMDPTELATQGWLLPTETMKIGLFGLFMCLIFACITPKLHDEMSFVRYLWFMPPIWKISMFVLNIICLGWHKMGNSLCQKLSIVCQCWIPIGMGSSILDQFTLPSHFLFISPFRLIMHICRFLDGRLILKFMPLMMNH